MNGEVMTVATANTIFTCAENNIIGTKIGVGREDDELVGNAYIVEKEIISLDGEVLMDPKVSSLD